MYLKSQFSLVNKTGGSIIYKLKEEKSSFKSLRERMRWLIVKENESKRQKKHLLLFLAKVSYVSISVT